jgi:long-chain acyl-CoA synthetase
MEFETIHEMYRHWFETRSRLAAYHRKAGGRWEAVTWQEFGEQVTHFALGLTALGMECRDAVTILSTMREEWDIAEKAVLSAGGVAVGCCHSNTPSQVAYVLRHSGSRFLIVENREKWDKVLQVREDLERVKRCIVIDPRGTEGEDLLTFRDVLELGRREREEHEAEWLRRSSSVRADDPAILFYTSGTTGPPKGAMLSHRNVLDACRSMRDLEVFSAHDVIAIWHPMPHVYGRIGQIAGAYIGTGGYYAEGVDKVLENLREIRPTIFCSAPQILENLHARILGEVDKASTVEKKIFGWALGVGLARSRLLQQGLKPSVSQGIRYRLADRLAFRKVRDAFGGRIRILVWGGAPMSTEILEFFHAAGILPLEMYGMTEASLCAMNRPDAYRFGSIGPAVPGVRIRIARDGEILVKSGMVFSGYLHDEERTREAFAEEGWFATGDVGRIDSDGFVWITGRKENTGPFGSCQSGSRRRPGH